MNGDRPRRVNLRRCARKRTGSACIDGLCDGTIDVDRDRPRVTKEDEKRCEFSIAPAASAGFETAFCISNSMLSRVKDTLSS